MEQQIIVKGVCKSYKTYIKGDGIVNSMLGFFHRKYENINAVSDIEFSIKQGEALGLIGLNGAGKTTTIKMVSGIMKPDKGSIKVLGNDPFLRLASYREKVALVMGQKGQLDLDLSIIDSIKLYASIYSIKKEVAINRAKDMAEELKLSQMDLHKQVRNLSLGQRMKGELILSFIHLPTIIFLDEPTLGLDFITQRAIRNYLLKYKTKYNASIILTSHYIKDIEDLCDSIYILNKGKPIYYGSIDDFKKMKPNMRKVQFNASDIAVKNLQRHFDINKDNVEEDQYSIRFNPEKMSEVMNILSMETEISNIKFHDDTLDVIIESLYEGLIK